MLSLRDALGAPPARLPLNLTTWVSFVLPPLVLGFIMGFLAIMPKTRASRVALWPIVAFLALRATIAVDMSFGSPGLKFVNAYFASAMFNMAARTLDFAFTKESLVRHLRPVNSTPSIINDSIDLFMNVRGLGWNWSHGMYIPRDARPTNRIPFIFWTVLSTVWYAFVFGVFHRAVLSFASVAPNAKESTIFDEALPFALRYLRASIISALTAIVTYSFQQLIYDLCTIPAVLFFGQDPTQWPPVFDAPWRATSIIELLGRRSHQMNRHTYLVLGGYPFSVFFGRAGTILGALIASAVMHDIFLLAIDPGAEPWRMLVGFGVMGLAMLAERAFYKTTGRKVGGVLGWVWMMVWLVVLGNGMIEGVIKAGGLGHATLIDGVVPVRVLTERLVVGFDEWLRVV